MRKSVIFGEQVRARTAPLAASLVVSVLVAGCSSDAQRFGITGSVTPSDTVAAAPRDPVQSAPLASPAGYGAGTPYQNAAYTPPANQSGQSVTVKPGDTAYSIASASGVTVQDLAAANGIAYPYQVNIGQRLVLPGGAMMPETSRPVRVASLTGGNHTVASGDTLYNISQRYGVGVDSIANANNLDNYGSIRIGQTLTIPSGSGRIPAQGGPLATSEADDEAERAQSRILQARAVQAEEAAAETRVARVDPAAAGIDIASPQQEDGRFRWPVRGRIISHYGVGSDGQRNDGVNISVPEGASVKAAEGGTVAYAGDELAGYGNLILIRHANDWVTAYAHNSTLLVSRGDTVQRGQIIAKAGQTGGVDRPQVHFEIRQGSKAVDPMPYLEGA